MKAVEIAPPGGPGSLRTVSRPRPEPGPGEVLVRVQAASLNYRDLRLTDAPKSAFVPVCECAGVIAGLGAGVRGFQPGDSVVSGFFQGWSDGPFRSDYLRTVPGSGVDGMLAEYVTLRADSVVPAPTGLTPAEASTIPCAGVTAYNALFGGRGLTSQDTVLVLGTGGVSLYALQFAVHRGARVIATSSSDERLERVRALGAGDTVNYVRTPDVAAEVLRLTGGRGAEFVVDVVGDVAASVKVLADNGELTLIGSSLGGERSNSGMRSADLGVGNTTIRRFIVGPTRMLVDTVALITSAGIRPVIGARYGLDAAADAFDQLRKGATFGKIVIDVAD